jgi:O-methyltransferase
MIISAVNKIISGFGYSIRKKEEDVPVDMAGDKDFLAFYEQCRPFTQTSIERLYSLFNACLYIIENKFEGDLVECGVWKGGSAMMMALVLKSKGITNKKIYLYDTYEGMSEPTEKDISIHGKPASQQLKEEDKLNNDSIWCYASYDEVVSNLRSTGYPMENLVFIKGKVEDTLQTNLPGPLALLRLDTDWYESTKVELEKLYPLLTNGSPLIIDDFGHWEGARKAVQEYFADRNIFPFLQRIDITGRLIIKT